MTQAGRAYAAGSGVGQRQALFHYGNAQQVWDKLGEAVAQYVEKGQRLYVAGRLVQSSWEGDDGQRRYRTEIHAQDVVFLDSARNGNGSGEYANTDANTQGDDDLPF